MNPKIFLCVLSLMCCVCCNKEQSGDIVHIEGMWAQYDGGELTKAFYEFKDGKYDYYISDLDYLLRYSNLWGADKGDFTRLDFGNYSVRNGKLLLGDRSAGDISLDADILTIGNMRYMKIHELKKGVEGASKILLETNALTFRADWCDKVISYRVINMIPGSKSVSAEYKDSPDWTLETFVSLSQICLGVTDNYESENPRTAQLVVSYPWAEDEIITLTQLAGRGLK